MKPTTIKEIVKGLEKTIKENKKNIDRIEVLTTYSEPNRELSRIEVLCTFNTTGE
mgnify:CR=1 FL=1|jgi:hypothetical protein|tara:strand:- start:340 stop:504 length:165 start_codon:yes stop_codon:yes gene_type:complete